VLSLLTRLDTVGLQACRDCVSERVLGLGHCLCEYSAVERRRRELLGRHAPPLDPHHPDDLAIGIALQIEGEQTADEARARHREIIAAANEGKITVSQRNSLLKHEDNQRQRELASQAQILLMARPTRQLPSHDQARLVELTEREYERLTASETKELQQLRQAYKPTVYTDDDDRLLRDLTASNNGRTPQPQLPDKLMADAERRVRIHTSRLRGELPARRRTGKPRRSYPTFERRSFTNQLGNLATERDPDEIRRGVRELRRQAKQHGFLPAEHDRRH
jgi:hypothetical protein